MCHIVARGFLLLAVLGAAGVLEADHHKRAKGGKVTVTKKAFGNTKDGRTADLYTIQSPQGMAVEVTNYGAMVTSILAPDRHGKPGEVTLGFDTLDAYLAGHPYFGCTVGRYCNRIADAKFALDGHEYKLPANNGKHCLHGGDVGFDKRLWNAELVTTENGAGVRFSLTSEDGDQGFPGKLQATVLMLLSERNELSFEYTATTDRPTVVNLTNHTYWNLAGPGGDVLDHKLTIHAGRYTAYDKELIPTGKIESVDGTPFDFTRPKAVGRDLARVEGGYDLNYVLDGTAGEMRAAASLYEPTTGRVLDVFTLEPGIQFYSGNFLDGTQKGRGTIYRKHGALCLETQHYPDSPNHAEFPSTTLRPGETYRSKTVCRFSAKAKL